MQNGMQQIAASRRVYQEIQRLCRVVKCYQKLPELEAYSGNFTALCSLRRPCLFRLAGKDRGEKGRLEMRLAHAASEFG